MLLEKASALFSQLPCCEILKLQIVVISQVTTDILVVVVPAHVEKEPFHLQKVPEENFYKLASN